MKKRSWKFLGTKTCDKSKVEVSLLKFVALEGCFGKQKMVLIYKPLLVRLESRLGSHLQV